MSRALITGASRGIGAALAIRLALDGWEVWASCRRPDAVREQFEGSPGIRLIKLDITKSEDLSSVRAELADKPLDLLVNNAAIPPGKVANSVPGLDFTGWALAFNTNCLSQIRVTETLLPNLRLGEKKTVVFLGSMAGVTRSVTTKGSIIYRSTKAALTSAVRSLAIDLRADNICCVQLNPGLVRSGCGGVNARFTPDESAINLADVISRLSIRDTGQFVNFDGKTIPL